jgi:phosphoglycolate phosphatase-like HAD superfamily hydrolase
MGLPLTRLAAGLPCGIQGILFDADNVLYDTTAWWRWLVQLLRHFRLRIDGRDVPTIWRQEFLDEVHRGCRDWGDAFHAMLLAIGLSPAEAEEVEAACQARRRQLETTLRLLPGVKSTLGKLHAAGLRLAVLANAECPGTILWERFDRLGLAGLFSTIVSSVDLERTMPDAVCYFTALRAMDLRPAGVAYVGHDLEGLQGAAAIGMVAVAMGYAPPSGAGVVVNRFEELCMLVGRPPLAAAG